MYVASFFFGRGEGTWLLWGGAAGLLFSVMVASRSLVRLGRPSPTLHALLHWLPIAVAALVAAGLGSPRIAVALVFGTSVGVLSTVTGFVTMAEPLRDVPASAQRIWMFLPVPALLVFLLGFGGNLGIFEAGALAIQGTLAGFIWFSGEEHEEIPQAQLADPQHSTRIGPSGVIEVILALALTAIAAWAATRGAERAYASDGRFSPGTLGATLLSVALVMPMISSGTPLAVRGQAWASLTAQAGVVMLNLCALLPAIVLIAFVRQWHAHQGPAGEFSFEPVLYLRMAWRVDAVVLLILCLLFVPVAAGRVRFERTIAGWLIGAYGVYLMIVIFLGRIGTM